MQFSYDDGRHRIREFNIIQQLSGSPRSFRTISVASLFVQRDIVGVSHSDEVFTVRCNSGGSSPHLRFRYGSAVRYIVHDAVHQDRSLGSYVQLTCPFRFATPSRANSAFPLNTGYIRWPRPSRITPTSTHELQPKVILFSTFFAIRYFSGHGEVVRVNVVNMDQ